jgi:hypothetical protein
VEDLNRRDQVDDAPRAAGLFLSMSGGWGRFIEVIELSGPGLVHDTLMIQGEFAARLADRVLRDVRIDAALFSEPIAENRGPLISPRMYREIVLPTYTPLLDVLKRHEVEAIIFVSWANPRRLLPAILEQGFNCLWAYEVNPQAMDYRDLRREFGRDLRLIGGIDLDVLRLGEDAIRREVEEQVPALLADGGYIPMLDGRVRVDVPFDSYCYTSAFSKRRSEWPFVDRPVKRALRRRCKAAPTGCGEAPRSQASEGKPPGEAVALPPARSDSSEDQRCNEPRPETRKRVNGHGRAARMRWSESRPARP